MKQLQLTPNQIISSSHMTLHNTHVLKIYYRIFQKKAGNILPPSPVMHKDELKPILPHKLQETFAEFETLNPEAEYFLLDGSHKTTAADLNDVSCEVYLLETQSDVDEYKKLEQTGDIFQYILGNTLDELKQELVEHFEEHTFFQTVEQKTQQLIKTNQLPQYMLR